MTQEQTQDEIVYDPDALQAKWQPVWESLDPFRAGERTAPRSGTP